MRAQRLTGIERCLFRHDKMNSGERGCPWTAGGQEAELKWNDGRGDCPIVDRPIVENNSDRSEGKALERRGELMAKCTVGG